MGERVCFNKILCKTVVYVLIFFSFFSAQAQNIEIQEVHQQFYKVAITDAKKLHHTTLHLSLALDKVSGVCVKESGGVESNFNFLLKVFTGRQVKFFMDGIPMENFGSSFKINNILINLAEGIDSIVKQTGA